MKITDRKIIAALLAGNDIKRESYPNFCVHLIEKDSVYSGFESYDCISGKYDDGGLCFGDLIVDDWEVVK